MTDETSAELEKIANELDRIADGLGSTNMLRARQLRGIVKRVCCIARNYPLDAPRPADPSRAPKDSS